MVFLLLAMLLLWAFYTVVIYYYNSSWRAMPDYQPKNIIIPNIRFSVIIPARNEESNIGRLLESLSNQTYPGDLFEIIVVDDHSADATAEVVRKFEKVKLIQLTDSGINSYKKKAIERGIVAAQNEWIVCTDADCMAGPEWLHTFASFIEDHDPVFIAAPVMFFPSSPEGEGMVRKDSFGGVKYIFQALDFLTLQGITAASVSTKKHNMCNGANLGYKRDVFYEVGGFKGIDKIASGDDMLLMYKIWKQYPDRIAYLKSKDVIVETEATATWKAFINQRIRWASKAKSYDDKRIFAVLLLVYLFNFSFLVLLVASFFNTGYLYAFMSFWILKTAVEYPFVSSVSKFFNLQQLMKYFFFFQPLHVAYTILAGFLGSFGKYEWKGRRVK
ncbi:MAG: glycosyltransferase [Niabella sp.]